MVKIAIVGTELAPLRAGSGALERVVRAWADGLAATSGIDVVCLDADPLSGLPLDQLAAACPDLLVLNNRPLWAERTDVAILHVLHNYPDAWGEQSQDNRRVRRALEGASGVAAVSSALARHVEEAYQLTRGVREVMVAVEEGFFGEAWRGEGGPVVFPNRLLEKKGVRLFLEIAELLSERGHRCQMSRHLAPWSMPTDEQASLLDLIKACGAVELLPPPATRAAMAAWYASAGVVVCPSVRPEGLGLVALEAQAVGAPLVTSGLGGLAEATFPPNEIVASLDPEEWCGAVERALARPTARGPRQRVEEFYSHDAAVSSIVEVTMRIQTRTTLM
ncbi:MAG: glycosyltransferase family 4 protein [Acidimicrobiales bacterium]